MVLSPKAQGLRLSTDGLQARLAQPPSANDVALFLHTSGGPDTYCTSSQMTGSARCHRCNANMR